MSATRANDRSVREDEGDYEGDCEGEEECQEGENNAWTGVRAVGVLLDDGMEWGWGLNWVGAMVSGKIQGASLGAGCWVDSDPKGSDRRDPRRLKRPMGVDGGHDGWRLHQAQPPLYLDASAKLQAIDENGRVATSLPATASNNSKLTCGDKRRLQRSPMTRPYSIRSAPYSIPTTRSTEYIELLVLLLIPVRDASYVISTTPSRRSVLTSPPHTGPNYVLRTVTHSSSTAVIRAGLDKFRLQVLTSHSPPYLSGTAPSCALNHFDGRLRGFKMV